MKFAGNCMFAIILAKKVPVNRFPAIRNKSCVEMSQIDTCMSPAAPSPRSLPKNN